MLREGERVMYPYTPNNKEQAQAEFASVCEWLRNNKENELKGRETLKTLKTANKVLVEMFGEDNN